MPKIKTHSGAKKRLKVTTTGKMMRRRSFSNHFLQKKSPGRKRTFDGMESLGGKQVKNMKRKLGV
jgi:large subunit ribosomal protein L35